LVREAEYLRRVMGRCSVLTAALTALTALAFVACCRSALACAAVPPAGWESHIEHEDALIIWDEASHTEHFIRTDSLRRSSDRLHRAAVALHHRAFGPDL
jgi:hypothetical protein